MIEFESVEQARTVVCFIRHNALYVFLDGFDVKVFRIKEGNKIAESSFRVNAGCPIMPNTLVPS